MNDPAETEDIQSLGDTVKAMTDAVNAQTQVLQDFVQSMNRQHVESARATGGRVELHIGAGGVALWIAATFSIVAVVSAGFLALALLWVAIKMNDMGHQQNAVYQSVPGPRELVAEQIKQNEQTSKPTPEEDQQ